MNLPKKLLSSLAFGVYLALSPMTQAASLEAVPVITGLDYPWSMVFLPDGEMLITERSGQLRRVKDGKLQPNPVQGLPKVAVLGQGGLLGLALHPQFAQNHWLYLSYTEQGQGGYSTSLARAKYQEGRLSDLQVLFQATPRITGAVHFGGRIVFDKQGYLYVGLGERGRQDLAQDTTNHAGSLIRLMDDGKVPTNNPLVNNKNAKPEIYSFGHRNIQGLTLNPKTGAIWAHEHGPQGGDEVNLIKAGANYGWPIITYGEQYGGGRIGEGKTSQAGMEQPLHYWVPSIAPSGMTFYSGDKYPHWQGDLFVGSLKFGLVVRLHDVGNGKWQEERYLNNAIGRIRDIQQAPDGYLYVLTDESNGGLYRLTLKP
ncbi:PQQ-dependent sugar dehydrogenase [Thiolinea disciformis]|uniref:PQQ-dependent sugar dehydrogenase n=1 Tax=Thiolinea disciformis TaxID=125614 RepID=UPI00039B6D63|nr:PQQ-dependent sugar dehydrogenase [Thiolinea disciformis]